jgi:hypothetical protein
MLFTHTPLNGGFLFYLSVYTDVYRAPQQDGLRDGINISTFSIREYIGSVLLIPPSSSYSLLEWSQWSSFVLFTKILLGNLSLDTGFDGVGIIKWICKKMCKKIQDGN